MNSERFLLDAVGSGGDGEHEDGIGRNKTIHSSLDSACIVVTSQRLYKLLLAFVEEIKHVNFSAGGPAGGRGD